MRRGLRVGLVAAAAALTTSLTGGLLTDIGAWYQALEKPPWQPPDWAFGPAWSTIFILTATAGALAWLHSRSAAERRVVAIAFAANALCNVGWSLLFFHLKRPDWALIEMAALWLSIVALIVVCARRRALAAWLVVPYLAWVSFAATINLSVVRLNGPFGG